jgi:RNA polymerase subunit RPABC4/transcription elongation factor Spt4
MPICFNCNTLFDAEMSACPSCHAKYNVTKENFIKYIGSEDSL